MAILVSCQLKSHVKCSISYRDVTYITPDQRETAKQEPNRPGLAVEACTCRTNPGFWLLRFPRTENACPGENFSPSQGHSGGSSRVRADLTWLVGVDFVSGTERTMRRANVRNKYGQCW